MNHMLSSNTRNTCGGEKGMRGEIEQEYTDTSIDRGRVRACRVIVTE